MNKENPHVIALIGIMGKGMLKNLITKLDASTTFIIWNRSQEVVDEIKSQFPEGKVTRAKTAKEVIVACEITFCMLSTPEASVAVFDSEQGS